MNPFIVFVAGTLFHMKRTCPRCKSEQIVPFAKKHDIVKCKYCGTDMPPSRPRRGTGEQNWPSHERTFSRLLLRNSG